MPFCWLARNHPATGAVGPLWCRPRTERTRTRTRPWPHHGSVASDGARISPPSKSTPSWRTPWVRACAGAMLTVVIGDATAMPLSDAQFSGVVSFTMLHHVPSAELQDRLLREVWRVLAPGGVFVGSDSIQSLFMRLVHIGDTLVPVDPDTVGARLEAAGFEVLEVEKNSHAFRFHARRPAPHL